MALLTGSVQMKAVESKTSFQIFFFYCQYLHWSVIGCSFVAKGLKSMEISLISDGFRIT